MAKSDKELLESIQRGDSEAFTQLYNKYWRLLYSWSSNRIYNREAVQDLMQNVWADIWQNPGMIKVNDKGSAKNILLSFVSYRILDFFKKKDLLVFLSDENSSSESQESVGYSHVLEEFQVKEIHKLLNAALDKLPQLALDIYMMSEKEHLTTKDIALRLSITEETVRRRLKWTHSFLRNELNKYYVEEVNILILLLYAQDFLK
jgi:RNA polymerase sigma factor (sigma-70 family)